MHERWRDAHQKTYANDELVYCCACKMMFPTRRLEKHKTSAMHFKSWMIIKGFIKGLDLFHQGAWDGKPWGLAEQSWEVGKINPRGWDWKQPIPATQSQRLGLRYQAGMRRKSHPIPRSGIDWGQSQASNPRPWD